MLRQRCKEPLDLQYTMFPSKQGRGDSGKGLEKKTSKKRVNSFI